MAEALKAAWPWPGGKGDIVSELWARIGPVSNYVSPFCGTAIDILQCPYDLDKMTVTANDSDGFITNALRSIDADPEATAYWCDFPVNEINLTATHLWLKSQREDLTSRLFADIHYYDPEIAGRWLWGIASWIGDGWCVADGPWINVDGRLVDRRTLPEEEQVEGVSKRMPHVAASNATRDRHIGGQAAHNGIHAYRNAPGVPKKMPEIGKSPNGQIGFNRKGIQALRYRNAPGVPKQMPALGVGGGDDSNRKASNPGVRRYREGVPKQMPLVSGRAGNGEITNGIQSCRRETPTALLDYFARLAARLRRVRFLCGDWSRCVKDSITVNHGLTGLLLDPPYPPAEHGIRYHGKNAHVWYAAAAWAVEHGDDPRLRLAVCGYHSEATDALFPDTWTRYRWEARGGYSNQAKNGRGRANAKREAIWFSPYCLNLADEARAAFSRPIVAGESDYAGTLFEDED